MSAAHAGAPLEVITPDWPAPPAVRAAFTLRAGGVSAAPFFTMKRFDCVHSASSPL